MTAKPSGSPVALCALRNDESQRVRQVPDRAAAIIDACRPNLDESQRSMKSIRRRVWRVAVDFTDNALGWRNPSNSESLMRPSDARITIASTDYERSVSRLQPMLRDARVARSSA